MKKIKFIIIFLLLLFGIILNAEMHQDYLRHFENPFPYTTFSLPQHGDQEKMIEEIYAATHTHNISLFTPLLSAQSAFFTNINIYYIGDAIPDLLLKQFDVEEKIYNSFLLGKTTVAFYEFSKIKNIQSVIRYMLIGNDEDIYAFKTELISKYGGSPIKPGHVTNEERNMVHGIYFLIGAVLLILTYYDILKQKKEMFVRVTMGETLGSFVLKNIILDTVILVAIFAGILFGLKPFTYTLAQIRFMLIDFSIIIILNAMLYFTIYRYNLKQAFSGISASTSLLSASYGLKFISLLITVLIISSNFVFVEQAIEYRSQESFFEKHKEYHYAFLSMYADPWDISLMEEAEARSHILREELYRKYFIDWDIQTYSRWFHNPDFGYDVTLYNQNTWDYLLETVTELNNYEIVKDKVYLLLSQNMLEIFLDEKFINQGLTSDDRDKEFSGLMDDARYFGVIEYDFDYEMIVIRETPSLQAIDRNPSTLEQPNYISRNTIIIFNNIDERNKPYNSGPTCINSYASERFKDSLFKASAEEILIAAEEFGFDRNIDNWEITNVYESYLYYLGIMNRLLTINFTLSLLMLVLEIILIITVIRLQYSVNAIELSIKKVLGYSLWERNQALFLMTSVIGIVGGGVALFLNRKLHFTNLKILVMSVLLVMLLEIVTVAIYARKFERINIIKLLKGGAITRCY